MFPPGLGSSLNSSGIPSIPSRQNAVMALPSSPSSTGKSKTNNPLAVSDSDAEKHDSVVNAPTDRFGDESHAAVKYKTMEWWHVGLLMLAETISLGVLSLSYAMAQLGLVPALILIVAFGVVSTYSAYVYGQFKIEHKEICDMQDAGRILGGKPVGWVLVAGQILVLVFVQAAHLNVFTTMMNVLTQHATCSITFSIIGLVVSFAFGLPRKLQHMSYLSVASCISVAVAVIITMVGVGIKKPDTGRLQVANELSLSSAMIAVLQIVLAYAGHAAYFGFQAELRDQRDFKKAVFLMNSCASVFYTVTAVVIYYYAGPGTPSPALSALGMGLAKVAWGVAIPTIVIAGIVNGHVACKAVYVRLHEGTNTIHERSFKAYWTWIAICATLWLLAWVIAEAIPNFPQLLALVSALFSGWFSFGVSGAFWLQLNRGRYWSTRRKAILTVVNIGIVLLGLTICVLGLYASGKNLRDGQGGKPFSCADTSVGESVAKDGVE